VGAEDRGLGGVKGACGTGHALRSERSFRVLARRNLPLPRPNAETMTVMNEEPSASSGPVTEVMRRRLTDVRSVLLGLHKALLDSEREDYERVYGQVNGGELLQLVIHHEQFAWLRPVSELIVRTDEMLDAVEPATAEDAEALLAGTLSLLKPPETGGGFGQKRPCASPVCGFAMKPVRNSSGGPPTGLPLRNGTNTTL
jgi:hypothetical protein